MKNVILELEDYCKFLQPIFKARASGNKEADLTCRLALLLVLDVFTRADRAHTGAELDAATDALDALTAARQLLEEELFSLVDPPPPATSSETAPEAPAVPREPFPAPPAPPPEVPHVPGSNGAAAAYVADAVAKHNATQRAPNG